MRVMTATEVKNKLGDALSFSDDDSLLIKKNGKEAFMVFTTKMAKKLILTTYVHGGMSRSETMKLMGFDWYGDLLDALAAAKMNKPTLPENERAAMTSYAKKILGTIGAEKL
jgi:hypothetical protein